MMKETKVTLKKIVLGIFMCLALALGIMPVEEVKATNTTTPSIDTSKTGSITIHKYTKGNATGQPGTGSSTDVDNISDDALALEGVKFTLYKVKNVAVEDYYKGLQEGSIAPITVDSLYTNDTDGEGNTIRVPDTDKVEKVLYNKSGDSITNPGETNVSGELVFETLSLGIYLVVESDYPDTVTSPADPFLVSLPLTTTTNGDGSNWLYDVHVYPKNSTTAGVTLKKTGADNQGLGGAEFVLQKYNATGSKWESITATLEDDTTATTLVTSSDSSTLGEITVKGLEAGKYRFVETSVGNNNVGYIMDGKTTYDFEVNANGTIDFGVLEAQKSIEIPVKNEKPDITKQVKVDGTQNTYANWADYSAGDTVDYQVKIKVPNNIVNLKKFQVVDTPTGLVDITEEGKINLIVEGGDAVSSAAYQIDKTKPTNGFTINFEPSNMENYANKTLVLSYSATLNTPPNTTKTGNPNTVQLIYNNQILPSSDEVSAGNPNPAENPGTPSDNLPANIIQDGAIVFSFQLGVDKTDENNHKLNGVEFDLYKQVDSGTANALDDTNANKLGLNQVSGKAWLKVNVDKLVTAKIGDSDGQIEVKGLENGTYAFVETKAAVVDGKSYNLLSKAVEVVVNFDYSATVKTTSTVDNKIVKNNITVSIKDDSVEIVNDVDAEETITIVNRAGFTLPTTGGAGGFLFTLVGCTIMIVGFIIFRKTKVKKADAA